MSGVSSAIGTTGAGNGSIYQHLAARRLPAWRIWLMAGRLPTLTASAIPVLVGTAAAYAQSVYRPGVIWPTLFSAMLIQLGTNLANDYFDFASGADGCQRTGPLRALPSGLLTPRQVATGAAVCYSLALLIGLHLVQIGGWRILAIGLISITTGILYTGGPWPLGYHGWGDLLTFIFFGMVAVSGTYYLHAGSFSLFPLLPAIPVGFLVTAILVANNIRDIKTDKRAGKYTLAVMLGENAARTQYAAILLAAFVVPLLMWMTVGTRFAMLSWLAFPLAIKLIAMAWAGGPTRYWEKVLGLTVLLHLVFGMLLAGSLILAR